MRKHHWGAQSPRGRVKELSAEGWLVGSSCKHFRCGFISNICFLQGLTTTVLVQTCTNRFIEIKIVCHLLIKEFGCRSLVELKRLLVYSWRYDCKSNLGLSTWKWKVSSYRDKFFSFCLLISNGLFQIFSDSVLTPLLPASNRSIKPLILWWKLSGFVPVTSLSWWSFWRLKSLCCGQWTSTLLRACNSSHVQSSADEQSYLRPTTSPLLLYYNPPRVIKSSAINPVSGSTRSLTVLHFTNSFSFCTMLHQQ